MGVVRPEARELNEPLESRNKSKLYDYEGMLRIGERLLKSEGAYWKLYSRESVERLLNELRVIETDPSLPPPLSKPGGEPDAGYRHEENQAVNSKTVRRRAREQRQMLRTKRRELSQVESELEATKGQTERAEHTKLIKEKKLEIRQLREAVRDAKAIMDDTSESGKA